MSKSKIPLQCAVLLKECNVFGNLPIKGGEMDTVYPPPAEHLPIGRFLMMREFVSDNRKNGGNLFGLAFFDGINIYSDHFRFKIRVSKGVSPFDVSNAARAAIHGTKRKAGEF